MGNAAREALFISHASPEVCAPRRLRQRTKAIINSTIEVPWCAARLPVPLTIAYLESQLQKSVRPVRGDFDLIRVDDRTT